MGNDTREHLTRRGFAAILLRGFGLAWLLPSTDGHDSLAGSSALLERSTCFDAAGAMAARIADGLSVAWEPRSTLVVYRRYWCFEGTGEGVSVVFEKFLTGDIEEFELQAPEDSEEEARAKRVRGMTGIKQRLQTIHAIELTKMEWPEEQLHCETLRGTRLHWDGGRLSMETRGEPRLLASPDSGTEWVYRPSAVFQSSDGRLLLVEFRNDPEMGYLDGLSIHTSVSIAESWRAIRTSDDSRNEIAELERQAFGRTGCSRKLP